MIDELVRKAGESWHDCEAAIKNYQSIGVQDWAFTELHELFADPRSFQYCCGTTVIKPTELGLRRIGCLKTNMRAPSPTARLTYETKTMPPAELYPLWKTEEVKVTYRQENDRVENFTIHYLKGAYGTLKITLDAQLKMTDCFGY